MIFVSLTGILALTYALALYRWVSKKDSGTDKMREIAAAIHDGAMVFLNREYRILVWFVFAVAAILTLAINVRVAAAFVLGAVCSALAGNIGMRIATKANVRTAFAVKEGIASGLRVAFSSGLVMGMSVVGIGVLGIAALYFGIPDTNNFLADIIGFGFGASSIALFARVGGGIFTKAADVGADLVGKVEAGIPEDDPRNPAVIADNVGDNVGDVAGMGADLFESYVNSIIAAMGLGFLAYGTKGMLVPLYLAGAGIIASILGSLFVKVKDEAHINSALNRGMFIAGGAMIALAYIVSAHFFGGDWVDVFLPAVLGLASGIIIGLSAEYYTSADRKPTRSIAEAALTGSATNIISGFSAGMMSTVIPILVISATILAAYHYAGLFGISIAAVGMLATLGVTLAADTYGPVADNAAGIAQMAGMSKEVRSRAEALDTVGNTTAAIGKGFAIGSAALTALALFSAYVTATSLKIISVLDPKVFVGLLIGGMLPFAFSSLTIDSVSRAAHKMVDEVRRQFKEIPGLMEGKASADSKRCIEISTTAALKEMVAPGIIAVIAPIAVGLLLGAEALGGLLAGNIVTGFLLAITMANAGGAWDNAKKYIESGGFGGKGTQVHAASVVGDTVGDPFKDTSGPSLNILIKLVSIVAVVFAPYFI